VKELSYFGHEARQIMLAELEEKEEVAGGRKRRIIHEPFGFRDGISQPIMRGSRRWSRIESSLHAVEPGELVLGYRDNLANRAPLPQCNGHDIGRNGTFLVVRQLEQDKVAFGDYADTEAKKLDGDPRVPEIPHDKLVEWVKAKMVGRWPDGTSLVKYPDKPGGGDDPPSVPDNAFMFGREDPDGLRCPLGAHVRRANPRDAFEAGSGVQLAITNRHRILRVGRVYEPAQGEKKPGLLFMCVNADIERQFEFLQQTWLLGPNFDGLNNEIDPVVGHRGDDDAMTIPTPGGPLRLAGLKKFVKVLGGGYFFMPSRSAVHALAG
jgi:deferrochelatase/peroxidase EfeB